MSLPSEGSGTFADDRHLPPDVLRYQRSFFHRQEISLQEIEYACEKFRSVFQNKNAVRKLDEIARSIGEYKSGNYQTSIILSWFVIEYSLSVMWDSFIKSKSEIDPITKDRREALKGKDFTASTISNTLELCGIISRDDFDRIDKARKSRNKIVHQGNPTIGATDASSAIEIAKKMIEDVHQISFQPNMGFVRMGL